MGLLYIMPVTEVEVDRVEIQEDQTGKTIILKSYGLPLIFWGYLAAILIVFFAMGLTINGPLKQMLSQDDQINKTIAYLVILTFIAIPITLICFLFYEKFISKKGNTVNISHRLFWLTIYKKTYQLRDENPQFFVEQFLDSPNIAKIQGDKEHRPFQNQGHYYLKAKLKNLNIINLDRHSRKADLAKICQTLSKY
jgi:hypothetical protein